MSFLIKRDYFILIEEEDLDIVSYSTNEGTTPEKIIEETEAGVIKEISSYLSGRYDVSKIFTNVFEYLNGETYPIGRLVFLFATNANLTTNYAVGTLVTRPEDGKVYRCLVASQFVYNNATNWLAIGDNLTFYTSLVATSAPDLFSDATKFSEGDTRDALMKRHVINIVLYELHSRINPRNIPEFRIQRRDDSVSWLKLVQDPRNNVSADFLPMKVFADKTGNDISWNSKKKLTHDY